MQYGDLVLCGGPLLALPFLQRLETAHAGGFSGISLGLEPYATARQEHGWSDADLRGMLADHGLVVDYVEALGTWLPTSPPISQFGSNTVRFAYDPRVYFAVAEAVGAGLVSVAEFYHGGVDIDVDVAAEALAVVADQAKEYGCRIALEFTPVGAIPDAARAWDILRIADRSNAGVLFDTWHYARGHSTIDQLLQIPADRYFALQISDTKAVPDPNLLHEAMHARLLPGTGTAGVAEVLARLDVHGVRLPFGAEVFSDELKALDPIDYSCRVARALCEVLPSRARAASDEARGTTT